jgi:hypothetical protein
LRHKRFRLLSSNLLISLAPGFKAVLKTKLREKNKEGMKLMKEVKEKDKDDDNI